MYFLSKLTTTLTHCVSQMRRRVKQVPVAFYKATPTSLFSESEFVGWTFKCKEREGEETGTIISEDDHNSAKRQRIES